MGRLQLRRNVSTFSHTSESRNSANLEDHTKPPRCLNCLCRRRDHGLHSCVQMLDSLARFQEFGILGAVQFLWKFPVIDRGSCQCLGRLSWTESPWPWNAARWPDREPPRPPAREPRYWFHGKTMLGLRISRWNLSSVAGYFTTRPRCIVLHVLLLQSRRRVSQQTC